MSDSEEKFLRAFLLGMAVMMGIAVIGITLGMMV